MELRSLHVYASHGQSGYRVTAEFQGPTGEVKLQVPGTLGDHIVNYCMDQILAQVRDVAAVTAEALIRGPEATMKEIEHG